MLELSKLYINEVKQTQPVEVCKPKIEMRQYEIGTTQTQRGKQLKRERVEATNDIHNKIRNRKFPTISQLKENAKGDIDNDKQQKAVDKEMLKSSKVQIPFLLKNIGQMKF